MADRKHPDWERIESDYRAGLLSLREIAARDGNVTESAIRKRAKRDGWTRDLSSKIQAKADDLVRRQVRRDGTLESDCAPTTLDKATEREIVDANATQVARVRGEHRADIQRSRRIAYRLLSVLEALEITEAPSEAVSRAKAAAEAAGKPFEPLAGASLKEHSVILRTLAETQRVLVGLEREAYGIDKFADPVDPDAPVDPVQGAKAIAFILARGAAHLQKQGTSS